MAIARTQAPIQVWVTRAQPGAEATANRLAALGYRLIVAPVLEVRALGSARIDLTGVDALAFTSANGVRTFVDLQPRRDLPVFCVGDATAATARSSGFSSVASSAGDVATLAKLVTAALPAGAVVVHPCAVETAGDLAGPLAAARISLTRLPVYETYAHDTLPSEAAEALDASTLATILIHSPKGAQAVAALLARIPAATLADVRVLAISQAALAPLRAMAFAEAVVAPSPDEASLLDLLSR